MFRELGIGPLLVVHLSPFLLTDWGFSIALQGFLYDSVDGPYIKPGSLNTEPTRRRTTLGILQKAFSINDHNGWTRE